MLAFSEEIKDSPINMDLYAPTEENFIKANRSIRQAWFNYFMYRNAYDEGNAKHWLEVSVKRVKFFCEKFGVSEQTLFMYF